MSLSLLTGAFAASAQRPARPNSPSGIDAGPINGSFEAALANWVTTGRVQVLQDTDIGSAPVSPVLPTDGGRMALLCNGPGNIDATELDNLDLDPGPNNDNDRSTLRPTLTFDWSFLTSEAPTPGNFDDFFRVNLSGPDGGMLLAGSAPTTGVSPFPDVTPIDGVVYDILAAGPTQGCHFEDGRSAFKQYLSIIDTPGTYILEFLVSDQGNADHLIDTGLLIDNVRLTPEIDLAVTKTANPNPALAGETLFYDITVNNYGSGVARDVVVTDVLPVDAVYVADTNVPPCVQAPAGTLTCQLGNMNGGTSKTFSIRTSLKADTRARGVLTLANSVHVEAATPDRDLTNNDFTLRTTVNDRGALRGRPSQPQRPEHPGRRNLRLPDLCGQPRAFLCPQCDHHRRHPRFRSVHPGQHRPGSGAGSRCLHHRHWRRHPHARNGHAAAGYRHAHPTRADSLHPR